VTVKELVQAEHISEVHTRVQGGSAHITTNYHQTTISF